MRSFFVSGIKIYFFSCFSMKVMIYWLCDTFEYPDIEECIGKDVHSRLNVREMCRSIERYVFTACLSRGTLLLFGGEYVVRKEKDFDSSDRLGNFAGDRDSCTGHSCVSTRGLL